jgi:hypothetical protein
MLKIEFRGSITYNYMSAELRLKAQGFVSLFLELESIERLVAFYNHFRLLFHRHWN